MGLVDILLDAAPFLWLAFLGAAPFVIGMTVGKKMRMVGYIVGAEMLLAVLLILVAIIAGFAPGSDGIRWGAILWAVLAVLIAGATWYLHMLAVFAKLTAERMD